MIDLGIHNPSSILWRDCTAIGPIHSVGGIACGISQISFCAISSVQSWRAVSFICWLWWIS